MAQIVVGLREDIVLFRGRPTPKCNVPLGRMFVEGGRTYQTSTVSGTFESVKVGERFRHHDRWCVKVSEKDAEYLKPDLPFGERTRYRILPELEPSRYVDILRIDERAPT